MDDDRYADRETWLAAQKRDRAAARKRERHGMAARAQHAAPVNMYSGSTAMRSPDGGPQSTRMAQRTAGFQAPQRYNLNSPRAPTREISRKTAAVPALSSLPQPPPWSTSRKTAGSTARAAGSVSQSGTKTGYLSDSRHLTRRDEVRRFTADILPTKSCTPGPFPGFPADHYPDTTNPSQRRHVAHEPVPPRSRQRMAAAAPGTASRRRRPVPRRERSSSPEEGGYRYIVTPGLRLRKLTNSEPVAPRVAIGGSAQGAQQYAPKAARKRRAVVHKSAAGKISDTISITSDSEHGDDDDASSDVEIISPPLSPAPSMADIDFTRSCGDDLKEALQAIMIENHIQAAGVLPFLRRNLRRGFLKRCASTGLEIPDTDVPDNVSVTMIYKTASNSGRSELKIRTRGWFCPVCALHGQFKTREILSQHLEWDHPTVSIRWENPKIRSWGLLLDIPLPTPPQADVHEPSAAVQQPPQEEDVPPENIQEEEDTPLPETQPPEDNVPRSMDHLPMEEESAPPGSRLPSVGTEPPDTPAAFTPEASPPIKQEPIDTAPPRPRPPRPTQSLRPEVRRVATEPRVRPANLPPHFPDPPPVSDPLGPAAVYPYLPAESLYGGPTMKYSCRISGPRLFDLLGTLPMGPYGAMAWYIIDREEEILEANDLSDEHKVIHALWARWIFVSRNEFVRDYAKGVLSFIDQYWQMIHLAAGWDALRHLLIILVKTRYLSPAQVVTALKHYESKTGMEYWCPKPVSSKKSKA
ncbi:hypothetical protein HGRIS_000286 [Hohenbuehelia grisea]|uniref:Polycomb protein VEFS-Box domain-containing protein n=1 Tax=Hohenbuehelia grisea TaxID=104357 RepID=A0ABR3JRI9_9AGAR